MFYLVLQGNFTVVYLESNVFITYSQNLQLPFSLRNEDFVILLLFWSQQVQVSDNPSMLSCALLVHECTCSFTFIEAEVGVF